MPPVGVEPTLCYQNWILSPARLPIPPQRRFTATHYFKPIVLLSQVLRAAMTRNFQDNFHRGGSSRHSAHCVSCRAFWGA